MLRFVTVFWVNAQACIPYKYIILNVHQSRYLGGEAKVQKLSFDRQTRYRSYNFAYHRQFCNLYFYDIESDFFYKNSCIDKGQCFPTFTGKHGIKQNFSFQKKKRVQNVLHNHHPRSFVNLTIFGYEDYANGCQKWSLLYLRQVYMKQCFPNTLE